MLDRIDLQVDVPPATAADLTLPPSSEGTAAVAARVGEARAVQMDRARTLGVSEDKGLNALLSGLALETACALDGPARALLSRAAEAQGLTARGFTRTLRLARTIADLEGHECVLRRHIAEALIYRRAGAAQAAGFMTAGA